jgi:hypothetical protein
LLAGEECVLGGIEDQRRGHRPGDPPADGPARECGDDECGLDQARPLSWVTSHTFRKADAIILDEAEPWTRFAADRWDMPALDEQEARHR